MMHQITFRRLIVVLVLLSLLLAACGDEAADQAGSESTETAAQLTVTPTETSAPTQPSSTPTPSATSTPAATVTPEFFVDLPDPPRALLSYAGQERSGIPGPFRVTQCADGICEATDPTVDASKGPKLSAKDRLAVLSGAEMIFTVDDARPVDVASVVAYPLDPQFISSPTDDRWRSNVSGDGVDLPTREIPAGVAIAANLPTGSFIIVVDSQIGEFVPESVIHEGSYSFRVITTPQPEDCSWSSSGVYRQINSIEELAWGSHRIVVGTVVEELLPVWGIAANSMEPNRRNIYTNYVFEVEQTLRGTPADTVLVRQMGGTIGGCSQADMDALPLIPGDRLLLFLTEPADGTRPSAPAYFITGGPQGYWPVQSDGTITTENGHLVTGAGLDLDVVIQRIQDTLAGEPVLRATDPLLVPIDESPVSTATPTK